MESGVGDLTPGLRVEEGQCEEGGLTDQRPYLFVVKTAGVECVGGGEAYLVGFWVWHRSLAAWLNLLSTVLPVSH